MYNFSTGDDIISEISLWSFMIVFWTPKIYTMITIICSVILWFFSLTIEISLLFIPRNLFASGVVHLLIPIPLSWAVINCCATLA